MVSGSAFGIEIYHNARSRDLPHLVVALSAHEQLSRAASQFLRLSRNWAKNSMAEMTLGSLDRVQLLGRGGYAHVELVRDIDGETYALKCINKSRVVAAGQRRHVKGTDKNNTSSPKSIVNFKARILKMDFSYVPGKLWGKTREFKSQNF